ncbi:hypothetical protein U8527_17005 [Kordia algicida OT-1]|uniref:Uncharacterized protein n=1 Tax=Kordia algicida OT-1 TaxID=391587 RepID=A9E2G0_9FLAO|nr:hypothetical protein [Kordia algicida]EDP95385.1 hypothetical protein KAOT1_10696 [Kordia algicida OT-1]
MFAKRYLSAFVILLTLLGFYKEQTPAPNQEIELQFTNQTVSQETKEVIDGIKKQLEALGVANIQVRQIDGALKIAYYSDENVAAIKELLLEEIPASNNESPNQTDDDNTVVFQEYTAIEGYKLEVYELHTTSNPFIGVQGKFILSLQKDYDKSPNPNSFANTNNFISGEVKHTIALAYTESSYTAIPKENTSYEIPDVRAGPFAAMHS